MTKEKPRGRSDTKVRPTTLFKYLPFGNRLVEQLCCAEVYFANPSTFNDPLDCQPVVVTDITPTELRDLLGQMILRRTDLEFDGALKKLRLRGDKANARRSLLAQKTVSKVLGDIDYLATDPDVPDRNAYIRHQLGRAIQDELRRSYDTGVLCLSAVYDSPLMWSHYADQHRGVCVEYDMSNVAKSAVLQVEYRRSRTVRASQIHAWLDFSDATARRAVHRACLLTKSPQWVYEQEWRMLGKVGAVSAPAPVRSITFGLRCSLAVCYTIVSALTSKGSNRVPEFYQVKESKNKFNLSRVRVDTEELSACFPQETASEMFDDLNAANLDRQSGRG